MGEALCENAMETCVSQHTPVEGNLWNSKKSMLSS